ncbi:MAG: DUF1800 domain-containing protein, partial [Rubrivivax sp.]|nr:DUF1800 domain-containing protein [Rubrivivax sp.]
MLAASSLLAACGGGGDSPPQAFLALAQAHSRRTALAATAVPASAGSDTSGLAGAGAVATVTELLDWAERAYPQYFPGHEANLSLEPYIYRHYPGSGNYVGVAGSDVYVLGPIVPALDATLSADTLVLVGSLASFTPQVYASRYAYSDAQAARFLNQATLGATDADIGSVRALGYAAWLEAQFAQPPSPGNWDFLVAQGIDVNPDAAAVAIGVDAQVWQRLMSAPDSLRQRVALALSEIFVVGFDGLSGPYKQFQLAGLWDLLAQNAFGSFRTLLEQVTLNPAMGVYLNTAGNQKEDPATGRQPDENYAREVMQLFTIGLYELDPDGSVRHDDGVPRESYTQDMVSHLARVFTGWNVNRPRGSTGPAFVRTPMTLTAALHSTLESRFLGTTIAAGTDGTTALRMALDTLAYHPNVGPFIGRQLIQRLVTSNPGPAYVARVSAAFADNGAGVRGDLQAVLRAVLLDEAARSDTGLADPQFGKLREPMLRLVQWARAFKASSSSGAWNVGNTVDPGTRLGQSPQRSASVFNFFRPGYVPPNTAIATAALVAPEFQITNESSVAGYLNYMRTV